MDVQCVCVYSGCSIESAPPKGNHFPSCYRLDLSWDLETLWQRGMRPAVDARGPGDWMPSKWCSQKLHRGYTIRIVLLAPTPAAMRVSAFRAPFVLLGSRDSGMSKRKNVHQVIVDAVHISSALSSVSSNTSSSKYGGCRCTWNAIT